MSERNSDSKAGQKTRGQDGLGLVLAVLGGFAAVSIFLALRGQESSNPLTLPVDALIRSIGASAGLVLSLGLAGLGVALFLRTEAMAAANHLLGWIGTACGISLLFGAVVADAGGVLGGLAPTWLGASVGLLVGLVLGVVVLVGSVWSAWLGARLEARKVPSHGAMVPTRRADADGVSAAEAMALQPARPEKSEAERRQLDVRRNGGVPPGTRPLSADADASEVADAPEAAEADDGPTLWDEPDPVPAAPGVPLEPVGSSTTVALGASTLVEEPETEDQPAPLGAAQRTKVAPPTPSWERLEENEPRAAGAAESDVLEPVAPEHALAEEPARDLKLEHEDDELTAELEQDEDLEEAAELEDEEEDELEEAAELEDDEDDEVDDEEELDEAAELEDGEEYEDDEEEELEEAAELEDDEDEEVDDEEELEEAAELEDGEEYEDDEEEELEEAAELEDDEDEEVDDEEELDEAAELEQGEEPDEAEKPEAPAAAETDERVSAPAKRSAPAKAPAPAAWEQVGLFDDTDDPAAESAPAAQVPVDVAAELAAEAPQAQEADLVLVPVAAPEESAPEAAAQAAPSAPAPEDMLLEAGRLILEENRVAVSMLQRRFQLDFDEACGLLDRLQELGLIGPYVGGRNRDILLSADEWEAMSAELAAS